MSSELRMDASSAAIRFFGAWRKLYEKNHIQFLKQASCVNNLHAFKCFISMVQLARIIN
jgi:hypothetical protein